MTNTANSNPAKLEATLRQCALDTAKHIDYYKHRTPPKKPLILQDYEREEESSFDSGINWQLVMNDHPEIKVYIEENNMYKVRNREDIRWLEECLGYLKQDEDIEAINTLQAKLTQLKMEED